jgi:hypothetical protein
MIWGFETTSSDIERLPKSESARFKIALKKKEGISHFGNALLFCLNSQLLFFSLEPILKMWIRAQGSRHGGISRLD